MCQHLYWSLCERCWRVQNSIWFSLLHSVLRTERRLAHTQRSCTTPLQGSEYFGVVQLRFAISDHIRWLKTLNGTQTAIKYLDQFTLVFFIHFISAITATVQEPLDSTFTPAPVSTTHSSSEHTPSPSEPIATGMAPDSLTLLLSHCHVEGPKL